MRTVLLGPTPCPLNTRTSTRLLENRVPSESPQADLLQVGWLRQQVSTASPALPDWPSLPGWVPRWRSTARALQPTRLQSLHWVQGTSLFPRRCHGPCAPINPQTTWEADSCPSVPCSGRVHVQKGKVSSSLAHSLSCFPQTSSPGHLTGAGTVF